VALVAVSEHKSAVYIYVVDLYMGTNKKYSTQKRGERERERECEEKKKSSLDRLFFVSIIRKGSSAAEG
jgi:hypothetical protein